MRALITLTVDRFVVVCMPPLGEPSPCADGATPEEWAIVGGLNCKPHKAIELSVADPLDTTPHDRETVAHAALQQLSQRGMVERVGGIPLRYRPRLRG